jgi:hypothetical protein
MSRLRTVFSSRHVVLPVIHVIGEEQARRNIGIACEAGADGAFLISHGQVGDLDLLDMYQHLCDGNPGFWLGVNCLGLTVEEMFRRCGGKIAGVWTDDSLIDETLDEQPAAQGVLDVQKASGWRGLYFGGVAFKYQRPVKDLRRVASLARPYMDVITTSGPGTGHAADPAKIRALKEGAGTHPLGIASGVTPENVTDYLPHADAFLVATGIGLTFDELDPGRVRDLVQVVRAWQPR